MKRFGWIQLLMLLACGLLAAGCGGQATSRPVATRVDAAVAACEKRVEASALSAALKDELKKTCAQDPSGDGMTSQGQRTRREVCRKIVLQRTAPGPARQRGLAACAVNSRNP